jgi:uncharacterized Zn-binding protein involved in type VI secretion
MISRSTRRFAAPALAVALSLGLTACGGDGDSPTSATPPPDVAGPYFLQWTLQVLRKSDGFQKQFQCYGQMTLVQGTATASTSTLSGFATVTSGCAPESYDLSGTVSSGGAIEFNTNGPKPPEGPCPGGKNVHFSGQVTSSGSSVIVSARGVTTVTCPEFGDHEFTYLINASK